MMKGHFVRHSDDSFVDEIRIKIVPRFKQSGLSGDEWRVHAQIDLLRKGAVIGHDGVRDMAAAAARLPWLLMTLGEQDDREALNAAIDRDPSMCHQPGCAEPATVVVRLKAEFCHHGQKHEPMFPLFRAFCDTHKTRGDCGLEDADVNYEVIDPAIAKGAVSVTKAQASALAHERRDLVDGVDAPSIIDRRTLEI